MPEAARGRGKGWLVAPGGREGTKDEREEALGRGRRAGKGGEGGGGDRQAAEGAQDKYGHPADSVRDDMRLAV